ncbi:MAG TPA: hypothetical protein VEZ41_09135 [Allosphingosinicella sp.]|nr:hypothetical protein [Allosphingosinicella sp.]
MVQGGGFVGDAQPGGNLAIGKRAVEQRQRLSAPAPPLQLLRAPSAQLRQEPLQPLPVDVELRDHRLRLRLDQRLLGVNLVELAQQPIRFRRIIDHERRALALQGGGQFVGGQRFVGGVKHRSGFLSELVEGATPPPVCFKQ